ncbi:methyltransferase domain-containing protein [Luteimonas deserti]|uniref:Methyltransferase domain-containing protein n=1 Tax=Luteimonas deserti TaxID=2752306 RepID=A0A7Z0QU48_9GAMM|nr:methyltransferase domain-containing protein [Luteimonas deserti]NYZ63991.1 methyltransferase domain-containing protein [Luteimonas deserti]
MPAIFTTGQPAAASDWFATSAGRAVLDSERSLVGEALGAHPGLPWLWLSPGDPGHDAAGRGLHLVRRGDRLTGPVRCACPLPLPSEAFGAVVLQHVVGNGDEALLEEAARVLAPGGHLWLLVLNPLTPYRWRWRGCGIASAEPLTWRRRLRDAGLAPDAVSRGVGPSWREQPATEVQNGPGFRAAYALRGQKRHLPLTPVRQTRALPLPSAAPAL